MSISGARKILEQRGAGLPQMSYGYDMPPEEYSTHIIEDKTPEVSDKPTKNRPGKVRDNTDYKIVNKYDISYKDKSILKKIINNILNKIEVGEELNKKEIDALQNLYSVLNVDNPRERFSAGKRKKNKSKKRTKKNKKRTKKRSKKKTKKSSKKKKIQNKTKKKAGYRKLNPYPNLH